MRSKQSTNQDRRCTGLVASSSPPPQAEMRENKSRCKRPGRGTTQRDSIAHEHGKRSLAKSKEAPQSVFRFGAKLLVGRHVDRKPIPTVSPRLRTAPLKIQYDRGKQSTAYKRHRVCCRHNDRIFYEHASVSVCRRSFASCIRSATMALGTRSPVVLRSQGRGADPRNLRSVQGPGRPTRQTPNTTFHGLHVGATLVLLEIPCSSAWQSASR